jgi:hypothetical protein
MRQTTTGKLSESRVLDRLISLGLNAYKPVPDRGIDVVASSPEYPDRIVNIQVKGRNPKKDPNWRWFQIRVSPIQMLHGRESGADPTQLWKDKVSMADFFVLDAIRHDEMWVLPRERVFDLISLNEDRYGNRPDNIFNYNEPLKQKQKEMNLDIEVNGEMLTERFCFYLNNFSLIAKAATS